MSERCEAVEPRCEHFYAEVFEATIIRTCTRRPWERCPLGKPAWEEKSIE